MTEKNKLNKERKSKKTKIIMILLALTILIGFVVGVTLKSEKSEEHIEEMLIRKLSRATQCNGKALDLAKEYENHPEVQALNKSAQKESMEIQQNKNKEIDNNNLSPYFL